MPDLKVYTNYRYYLRDYYEERKASQSRFSYRTIAAAVGFSSAGFFTRILNGQKNISQDMADKFASYLKLDQAETGYFKNLVQFNQAKTHKQRTSALKNLVRYKNSSMKDTGSAQFKFYQKWYYTAVRETLNFLPFKNDYKTLGATLEPEISAGKAKEAVKFLEQNGFIKKNSKGFYKLTSQFINAGPEVTPVSVHSFQIATMDLAKVAIDNLPVHERDISTLTLSLSEEGVNKIKDKLTQIRAEMLEIAEHDKNIDRVYQINFQAFPMSKKRSRHE